MRSPEISSAYSSNYVLKVYHIPSDQEIVLPAFITEFKDAYSQKWNEKDIYGRNDPHAVFSNTNRVITVGLTVPSESVSDALVNMAKMSQLAQMQYPTYMTQVSKNLQGVPNANSIQGSPMFKVKFMNWIHNHEFGKAPLASAKNAGLVGRMDGIEFAPDIEEGFLFAEENIEEDFPTFARDRLQSEFGTDMYPLEKKDFNSPQLSGEIYAKAFKLSFTLHVFHTQPLGWEMSKGGMKFRGKNGGQFPYSTFDSRGDKEGDNGSRPSKNQDVAGARTAAITGGSFGGGRSNGGGAGSSFGGRSDGGGAGSSF